MSETINESIRITTERIQSFLNGTKDLNIELHKNWALGFQLELILKNITDLQNNQYQNNKCTQIKSMFLTPVCANDKIQIEQNQNKLEIYVKQQKAATSTLIYQPPKTQKKEYTGNEYQLNEEDAIKTATGLFLEKPAYLEQAIGLISNSLFTDGKKLIEIKKQENKLPLYFMHNIEILQEAYNLKKNDKIKIKTNGKEKNPEKDRFLMKVQATKENGTAIYEGQVGILFKNIF